MRLQTSPRIGFDDSTWWRRLGIVARWFASLGHTPLAGPMTVGQRMRLISGVRDRLETVNSIVGAAILENAGEHAVSDAACFNLLGVACELLGDTIEAEHFYCLAIRSDGTFEAAQQNMRRLFELKTYGRSRQSIAVGHVLTDLVLQRHGPRQWQLQNRPF